MSLPTPYQDFIHLSRYSRWLEEERRRETWDETVSRYFDFFVEHLQGECDFKLTPNLLNSVSNFFFANAALTGSQPRPKIYRILLFSNGFKIVFSKSSLVIFLSPITS